jgi:hypothetical protein
MLHPVLKVGISLIAAKAAECCRTAADQQASNRTLDQAQHKSQLTDKLWIYDRCKGALCRLGTRRATTRDEAFSKRGEGSSLGGG